MNPSCLQHRLTDAEREQFNKNGYIVVKGAISPDQVSQYIDIINKLNKTTKFYFLNAFVKEDKAFLDVMDNPRVLPKIWGILGWNIYLQHSHLSVTPFCGSENDKSLTQWHRDGGRIDRDVSPYPKLSVKVGYSLTSTPKARMGGLLVVPGSHLIKGEPDFKKGIEIIAEAGDATIFDQRIWHAPGANCSKKPRIAIFCGYSFRWMRPHDIYEEEFIDTVADPIRKQLLGHYGKNPTGYSYYQPKIEDTPLQEFFVKHKL